MPLPTFLSGGLGLRQRHSRKLSRSSPDGMMPAPPPVQSSPIPPRPPQPLSEPWIVFSPAEGGQFRDQQQNNPRVIVTSFNDLRAQPLADLHQVFPSSNDNNRATQSLTDPNAMFSSSNAQRGTKSLANPFTDFSSDPKPPQYNTHLGASFTPAPFSPSHAFWYHHSMSIDPPLPSVYTDSQISNPEELLSKSSLRDIWLQCFDEVVYNDLPQYLIYTETMQVYPRSGLRNVFLHHARKKPLSLEDARRKKWAWGDKGLRDYYKTEIKQIIKYAIFSHRWGASEPTFGDVMRQTYSGHTAPADLGYEKLRRFCDKARSDYGCEYVWSDTCCINKESSAELEEAIRSMYRWYRDAYICIVYLAQSSSIEDFPNEPWFSRVWTLQELLAPERIRMYGKNWTPICPTAIEGRGQGFPFPNDKRSQFMIEAISKRTGIDIESVRDFYSTSRHRSLSEKMAWASDRYATRVEDTAYSLLGIFDVTMPIAYGEGERAFARLLDVIAQRSQDPTFFAWSGYPSQESSALPLSPASYRMRVPFHRDFLGNGEYNIGKLGVSVKLLVLPVEFLRQPDGSYTLRPRDAALAEDVMISYRLPRYISDREFMYAVGVVNFRSSKNTGYIEAGAQYFCIFMRDVSKYTYNINLGESTNVFVREQGAATLPTILSSRTHEFPLTDVCLLHRYS